MAVVEPLVLQYLEKVPGASIDQMIFSLGYGRTLVHNTIRSMRDKKLIYAKRKTRGLLVFYVGDSPEAVPVVRKGAAQAKHFAKKDKAALPKASARKYGIDTEEVAPGHKIVRFGDYWRAGKGVSVAEGKPGLSSLERV